MFFSNRNNWTTKTIYRVYEEKDNHFNIHEYSLCFTEEKMIGGLWPLGFENNCYHILSAQLWIEIYNSEYSWIFFDTPCSLDCCLVLVLGFSSFLHVESPVQFTITLLLQFTITHWKFMCWVRSRVCWTGVAVTATLSPPPYTHICTHCLETLVFLLLC